MAEEALQEQVETAEIPVLDNMGIKMDELIQEFNTSQQYVEPYTRDFVLLDNLVDGVPIMKEENTPFVGDTTLAGLVRSIPRQSLKQLPVLSTVVNGTKNSVQAFICNYLLKKTAFNEDTFGKGLLSTLQIGAEQALTHGYAPFMVASGLMYNDFGTTMRLLHYSDTSPEPGIFDSNESGYHFVVANLTPGRMRKILKNAESNEKTSWNLPALRELLKTTPTGKDYSQYHSDPKKVNGGTDVGQTYEIATRYETGPDSTLITFSPQMPDAPLRVLESRSKWGYPRVMYLVIDPAALSPFGTSRVRLASPNQNFMNIYLQNIAAMLLLNSAPPVFKKGTFLGPTPLKRNAVWASADPNAEISLKMMDNGALAQFVPMSNQFAGQIQNIMGGQTQQINAGSKGAIFGKTAPGVAAGQEFSSIETNQVTKILENFLRQYGLVALDVLLSEQTGKDQIIVDDETKNAINQLAPNSIGDDNVLEIEWEVFYDEIKQWSIEVDVSLSPDQLKDEKRADLQDMLVVLAQNARDLGPGAMLKVQEITDMLLQDKVPMVKPMGAQPPMPAPVPAMGNAPEAPPQM